MSERQNRAAIWRWFDQNWRWLIAYVVTALLFIISFFGQSNGEVFTAAKLQKLLAAAAVVLFALVFVQVFTTPIPLPPPEHMEEVDKQKEKRRIDEYKMEQRRRWMIYSYGFMLLSLFAVFYIFSVYLGNGKDIIGSPSAAIAVFVGCSESTQQGSVQPGGLRCYPEPKAVKKTVNMANNLQRKIPSTSESKTGGVQPEGNGSKLNGTWVVNIGGYVTNAKRDGCGNSESGVCRVQGGLLIPLYVVILALMGGSISLTRRLPEYQVRASPGYVATEKDPALSQHQLREFLVFQIVQLISAPLIAVLACYLVTPEKTETYVVLGFTAGFASESILLMVRSVLEKITPVASNEAKFGTLSGVVTHAGKPAAKAEISLVAHPQIRTITDSVGHFVLGGVPVGEHAIKVVSQKKAGEHPVEKSDTVHVDRPQAVVTINVDLA